MKRIVITGGTSFIGRNLELKLASKVGDYEIVNVSKSAGRDIALPSAFDGLEADYVIHLAALTRHPDPVEMLRVNVNGTLNVLEFCRRTGAKHIFASSAAVYGPADPPVNEQSPLHPGSLYGLTKKIAEELCLLYNRKFGVQTTVLRIFNLYGPRQKPGVLIPDILAQLDKEEVRLGNPYPRRDYVFVDDVSDAIIKSLTLQNYEIINIGTGKSYSVEEIAKRICGDKKIIFTDHSPIKDDSRADISKARQLLDWEPKVSLEDGLKKTLEN